jgi:hypothetical protein
MFIAGNLPQDFRSVRSEMWTWRSYGARMGYKCDSYKHRAPTEHFVKNGPDNSAIEFID